MSIEDSKRHIEKFTIINDKGEVIIDPILDLALIYYVGKDYFVNEESYEEELALAKKKLFINGTTEEEMNRVEHLMKEFAIDEERVKLLDDEGDPHMRVLELMSLHFKR